MEDQDMKHRLAILLIGILCGAMLFGCNQSGTEDVPGNTELPSVEEELVVEEEPLPDIEDTIFAAVFAEHTLVLKAQGQIQTRCRITGVMVKIKSFQTEHIKAIAHHGLHSLLAVALSSKSFIPNIYAPDFTLPSVLNVG